MSLEFEEFLKDKLERYCKFKCKYKDSFTTIARDEDFLANNFTCDVCMAQKFIKEIRDESGVKVENRTM